MVDVTSILTGMLSGGQSNSGGGQLGDLLNSVIKGGGAQAQSGGGGLGDILGKLAGGATQSGGGGLGDILGQLTGGAGQQGGGGLGDILGKLAGGATQSGGGGLGDLLGQLTGGAGQQQQGGGGLGDLLGGLLGGAGNQAAPSSGGGMGDILSTLATSGALAGLAGAVFGGGGSAMAKNAAKIGGIAVLANLAMKVLANYKAGGAKTASTAALLNVKHDTSHKAEFDDNTTATLLLRAMVAAAAADGNISDEERQAIVGQLTAIGVTQEQQAFIDGVLENPVDMASLVSQVSSDETKAQLYLASAMVIDVDTEAEEDYLASLADAMGFSSKLKNHLDHAALAAKSQEA